MRKDKRNLLIYVLIFFVCVYFFIFARNKRRFFVILSSNIDDLDTYYYTFYLPLAAFAWKSIGYTPIIFLVSSDFYNINMFSKIPVDFLNECDIQTIKIHSTDEYQILTSKLSRIFAGFIENKLIRDNDYILISDADLIPINRNYYQVAYPEEITVWNAECCGSFDIEGKTIKMYPMSHIGMTKSNWKKVTNLHESLNLKLESIDSTLILNKLIGVFHDINLIRINKLAKENDAWFSDQKMISLMIHNYTKFNNLKIDEIKFRGFRLDRNGDWNEKILIQDLDKYTDFHLFHEELSKKWPQLEAFFDVLFKNKFPNVKKYISDYKKMHTEFF